MSYNYLAGGIDRYLNEAEALDKFTAEAKEKMKTFEGRAFVKTSKDVGSEDMGSYYSEGHLHWYALDQNGNGVTLSNYAYPFDGMDEKDIGPDEHIHEVKSWIVQQVDKHTHEFDLRKAAQEELGRKIIEDPMTLEDVNQDNIDPNPLENLEK